MKLLSSIVQEQSRMVQERTKQLDKDAENIRALARIADMHDRRITRLERGERQ
jgi:hypothetical protein